MTCPVPLCTPATMPAFLNAVAACVLPDLRILIAALTAAASVVTSVTPARFTESLILLESENPAPEISISA